MPIQRRGLQVVCEAVKDDDNYDNYIDDNDDDDNHDGNPKEGAAGCMRGCQGDHECGPGLMCRSQKSLQ